ncbi:MAG: phosphotransferase enzyme family protein [Treponema sp.]|uniref:phosphotransferase enzyme family protein n=1 Tax=Treponema sp. TaxID=166 RepID=UPI003FA33FB3
MENNEVAAIFKQFALYGDLQSFKAFGGGHINSTYLSVWDQAGVQVRYTHQRINKEVFKQPEQVVANIRQVTEHIAAKLGTNAGNTPAETGIPISRRVLQLIPTRSGQFFYIDPAGEYWRTYLFIEQASTFEVMESPELAHKVGVAVGTFQHQLADYAGAPLYETIPDFHNMHSRYAQLDAAVARDAAGRLPSVRTELAFLEENRARGMILSDGLADGSLKRGITHNDTKLNNILFDDATGEAICLIDLDTVMPGTILFDTGDLIRTASNTACEDEQNLSLVRCNREIFAALTGGYLRAAGGFLTAYEKSLIAESGRVLTQIMAVRFLTDYLNGDVYYKISRPTHNLDRARTQIALMQSMDSQWEQLLHCVEQAM